MEGDGETHGSARKLSVFPIFFLLGGKNGSDCNYSW